MKVSKIYPALLCVLAFVAGGYFWKISKTERTIADATNRPTAPDLVDTGILVKVEDLRVTADDLRFEYDLLTARIWNSEELTPIPDLGDQYETELASLKGKILDSLVERKVLYRFVQHDKRFDLDNPSRYVGCLNQWMTTIESQHELFASPDNQQRLKERLCELSVLHQYLSENVYASIAVSEDEVVEYFRSHASEFKQDEMVKIRQVVLPDDHTARKIRARLTRANFTRLAKQHSITPEASLGGQIGPFTKGQMPPFFDVVFLMKPGQISDVLKSTYGFHIVTLDKKYAKKELSLEEARSQISEIIKKKKQEREYQRWVDLALHSVQVTTPRAVW